MQKLGSKDARTMIQRLEDDAREHGARSFEWSLTGKRHIEIKCTGRRGSARVFTPEAAGRDARAYKNCRAELRRQLRGAV